MRARADEGHSPPPKTTQGKVTCEKSIRATVIAGTRHSDDDKGASDHAPNASLRSERCPVQISAAWHQDPQGPWQESAKDSRTPHRPNSNAGLPILSSSAPTLIIGLSTVFVK